LQPHILLLGPVRRTEVEQQDVRLKLLNQLYRFLAVARLACHPQISLRLEQLAEAFTKEREVGGDYDPNCISRTSRHRLNGTDGAELLSYVPFVVFTYLAISSCVANHTPGFDFMCTISFSSPATRDRCPVMCGCMVRMKRPPSSYATSNSD